MITDEGFAWYLLFLVFPNLFSIGVLLVSAVITIIPTFLGGLLILDGFKSPNKIRSFGKLAVRNGLCIVSAQYAGLLLSLIISFILSSTRLGFIDSEWPLKADEWMINQIYGYATLVLCMAASYVASYFIAFKKLIFEKKKRILFSLINAFFCGCIVFLAYTFMFIALKNS